MPWGWPPDRKRWAGPWEVFPIHTPGRLAGRRLFEETRGTPSGPLLEGAPFLTDSQAPSIGRTTELFISRLRSEKMMLLGAERTLPFPP